MRDVTPLFITIFVVIPFGITLFCLIKDTEARKQMAENAEVTVYGHPYIVTLIKDKGSGKTMRCIRHHHSLVILPDAAAEKREKP